MQIKLTAKRQATFPKELCDEMHLAPGHAIQLEPAILGGRRVWVLSPPAAPISLSWVGSLRRYAQTGSSDMDSVRTKIAEAMARGEID